MASKPVPLLDCTLSEDAVSLFCLNASLVVIASDFVITPEPLPASLDLFPLPELWVSFYLKHPLHWMN